LSHIEVVHLTGNEVTGSAIFNKNIFIINSVRNFLIRFR